MQLPSCLLPSLPLLNTHCPRALSGTGSVRHCLWQEHGLSGKLCEGEDLEVCWCQDGGSFCPVALLWVTTPRTDFPDLSGGVRQKGQRPSESLPFKLFFSVRGQAPEACLISSRVLPMWTPFQTWAFIVHWLRVIEPTTDCAKQLIKSTATQKHEECFKCNAVEK